MVLLASSRKNENDDEKSIVSNGIPDYVVTLETIQSFLRKADADDLMLFYFSGHGITDAKGNAYIVLHDTLENDSEKTTIPMSLIKKEMKESPAAVKVIILDTCYSGKMINSKSKSKFGSKFIKQVFETASGFAILTSCSPDQYSFSYDDEKTLSAFTHFLIEALRNGNQKGNDFVTGHDLYTYVYAGVSEWAEKSKKPQTPKYDYDGDGDPIIIDWRK